MSLTLVSDWGGGKTAGSWNVYATLSDVDTYLETVVRSTGFWTDASTAMREAALVQASREIDDHPFEGERYYTAQVLEFPRTVAGAVGSVAASLCNEHVKYACVEQALAVVERLGKNPDHADQVAGIKSRRIEGAIPVVLSYTGGGERLCAEAVTLLAPYMASGPRIRRG